MHIISICIERNHVHFSKDYLSCIVLKEQRTEPSVGVFNLDKLLYIKLEKKSKSINLEVSNEACALSMTTCTGQDSGHNTAKYKNCLYTFTSII